MATATDVEPEQIAPAVEEPSADAPAESPVVEARNPSGLIVGIRLHDTSLQRIREVGTFEVSNEIERAGEANLIAITTRTMRGQTARIPAPLDLTTSPPVVVICHPGGEATAVALMHQGCAGVVAEGNERALSAYLDPDAFTETLVDGFMENQGAGRPGLVRSHRDPVTNLPELASFEGRLGEFVEAGTAPNVVMMQVTNLDNVSSHTDGFTVDLLRRRLASSYNDAVRKVGCEVFSLGKATFAVLDGEQRLYDMAAFAGDLIAITEAFRPAGVTLKLAVGAVAARAGNGVMAIREQAEQAVTAAAQSEESAFVTAEEVTVLLASSTEYQVAKQLASYVDAQLPVPDGHSARVADFAADMARELGYQGRELTSLKLAALLHDIGKISIDTEASETYSPNDDYPERGARYVWASTGPEIADAIRYQTERWDGTGPQGLAADDIPVGARVIAIADAADTWLHPPPGTDPLAPTALADKINSEAGVAFDPSLAETALKLFGGT